MTDVFSENFFITQKILCLILKISDDLFPHTNVYLFPKNKILKIMILSIVGADYSYRY